MKYSGEKRQDIIDELINIHGLKDYEIYLIDLFPLIEMIWVDGKAQTCEMSYVTEFCMHRVVELDKQYEGLSPLSIENVNDFLEKYFSSRPNPALLKTVRHFVKPIHLSNADPAINNERREKILDYCIDIAAAAVYRYPYEKHERFIEEEKQLLKDIIHSVYLD